MLDDSLLPTGPLLVLQVFVVPGLLLVLIIFLVLVCDIILLPLLISILINSLLVFLLANDLGSRVQIQIHFILTLVEFLLILHLTALVRF